jgi:ATPase subunit of ABC transporter with duplicated ATPase domains
MLCHSQIAVTMDVYSRAVAHTLHFASEHIMTTTRFLTGSHGSQLESTFRRMLQDFLLTGESLAQSLTEAGGERKRGALGDVRPGGPSHPAR